MTKEISSQHAQALSKLGAAKGGKARAESLTSEERKGIARRAAEARWSVEGASKVPRETYTGIIRLGSIEIPCGVLEDGTRVISTRGINRTLGSTTTGTPRNEPKSGARQLPYILASEAVKSRIDSELMARLMYPREYRPKRGGRTAFGHEATLLPEICDVILEADRAGGLGKRHENIVRTANILMRGFARLGIIALIDEATGYQEDREKKELARILEAYIEEELRPYVGKFKHEFFKQIYRLHGWEYKPNDTRSPRYIGKFINKYIYDPLPPQVLPRLKEINPANEKGQRKRKHFQYLTEDIGEPHLDKQLATTTALMKISDDVKQFDDYFRKVFTKHYQQRLPYQDQEREPLVIDVEGEM